LKSLLFVLVPLGMVGWSCGMAGCCFTQRHWATTVTCRQTLLVVR